MTGNKSQPRASYIIEYSRKKVVLIALAEIGFYLVIIFLIYLVLSASLGSGFFYGAYRFFVYLYLIVAMLSLMTSSINYCRQRKQCKAYQLKVNDTEISVEDILKKRKLKFNFADIRNYTVINCGYSIYEAIKLEIKESKTVMIYSLMKNYRKFKKEIKKSNILGIDYIYKSLGYTEENIY